MNKLAFNNVAQPGKCMHMLLRHMDSLQWTCHSTGTTLQVCPAKPPNLHST